MCNYCKIYKCEVTNGSGIGVSVFLSGCDANPKCQGCFNPEAWEKDCGNIVNIAFYDKVGTMLNDVHTNHLSILGGEPLADWNLETTKKLCLLANKLGKKVWVWTWRTYEDLIENKYGAERGYDLLQYVDYLVDGRYIEEQRDLTLKFRGSSNQRIINVKASLEQNKTVVLY